MQFTRNLQISHGRLNRMSTRTQASGTYVGLAPWAWFSNECFRSVSSTGPLAYTCTCNLRNTRQIYTTCASLNSAIFVAQ